MLPKLSRDSLLNEISCTAINIDEMLLDVMHRDGADFSKEARWATLESIRTLPQKIGAMADHLHSPGQGDVRGDAYEWMGIPKQQKGEP